MNDPSSKKSFKNTIIEILLDAGGESDMDHEDKFPLYYAWLNKRKSVMGLFLERGLDDILDGSGNSLLHYAVRNVGNTKLVEHLLNKGASINRQNEFGQTALHIAASQDKSFVNIKLLVERGADVNIGNHDGEIALFCATKLTNYESIKLLVNYGSVDSKDQYGNTGLHISATKHDRYLLSVFLEAGANVNEVDKKGNTALHLSVLYSDIRILKRLLDTDIDVDLKNSDGLTPYCLALHLNNLGYACLLLERTTDVNGCDGHGNMLIHVAVKNKSTDLLKQLITRGENLHHKNREMMTPLHLAAASSYKIGVHMFLANEIKEMSRENGRALFMAILRKDASSLNKLLSEACDVNVKDSRGRTPLHWAVLRGFSLGVRLLLKKGFNVNERDEDRRTALHFAAILSLPQAVPKMLLHEGGLVDPQDCRGNTPFHLALKCNNYSAVQLLLMWGAADLKNNSGHECFLYIFWRSNELIRILFNHFVCLKEANLNTYNKGLNPCEMVQLFEDFCSSLRDTDNRSDTVHLREKCERELNEMIGLEIGGFYLHNVLTAVTPSFCQNFNELKSIISSFPFDFKFPIYGEMLKSKLVRKLRFSKCVDYFQGVSNDSENEVILPLLPREKILKLLPDEDLVSIFNAATKRNGS